MEKPGFSGDGAFADKISGNQIITKSFPGPFRDNTGRDLVKSMTVFDFASTILFRTFFNTVDYNGEFLQEMRK